MTGLEEVAAHVSGQEGEVVVVETDVADRILLGPRRKLFKRDSGR